MNQVKLTEKTKFMSLITIIGGFCSGYIFNTSLGMLTNGQTGNTTKFAHNLAVMDFGKFSVFFFMLCCCIAGTVVCAYVKDTFCKKPETTALLIEILLLSFVGLLPNSFNYVYTCACVTFITGFQINIFRTHRGNAYNTTICSGAYRTIGQHLYEVLFKNAQATQLINSVILLLSFGFGTIFCTSVYHVLHGHTILLASVMAISALCWIKIDELSMANAIMPHIPLLTSHHDQQNEES